MDWGAVASFGGQLLGGGGGAEAMPGDVITPSIGPVSVGGLNAPPMPSGGFFTQQAPTYGAGVSPGVKQIAVAVAGAVAAAAVLALLKKRKG